MKKSLQELIQSAAYHEAGHAVAFELLGQGCQKAWVRESKDKPGTVDACTMKVPGWPRATLHKDIKSNPADYELKVEAIEFVQTKLAGHAAQRIFDPEVDEDAGGSESDIWEARPTVDLLCNGDQDLTKKKMSEFMAMTTKYLSRPENKRCLVAVADALIAHEEISGEQITQLVEAARVEQDPE